MPSARNSVWTSLSTCLRVPHAERMVQIQNLQEVQPPQHRHNLAPSCSFREVKQIWYSWSFARLQMHITLVSSWGARASTNTLCGTFCRDFMLLQLSLKQHLNEPMRPALLHIDFKHLFTEMNRA